MNEVLFENILAYITYEKNIPSIYVPDRLLYIKTSRKFILDKFLNKWTDDISQDPIDIIDSMLMRYYSWEDESIRNNNKDLFDLYDIYIKALLKLKKYINKENSK